MIQALLPLEFRSSPPPSPYLITGLLQVLHWFNPLVWYGFYRMRQDGEVACDALVLSRFRPAERVSYGRTMIKLAAGGGSRPALLPGLAGIVEEESQIKRRIAMISRFKNPPLALILAGVVILAVLCIIFLTSARPGPEISYGLGNPGAFVVYAEEQSAEIGRGEEGYEALLEAVEETMMETGLFEADDALKFPAAGIGDYLVQASYTAGLEVIYDQPVELSFIGEKNVYRLCLFIDAHKGLLFISTDKEGSYRDGGYTLVGSEALRQICEELERELFPAPPWWGIDNPERITVRSGDYIAELHRGEEDYGAILSAFLGALPETGPLDPLDTLHFGAGGLKQYLDNKGTTAWLEFYYDEPAEFALIGREVNYLLIDLDEAALFWGRSDALYYRGAPYFLSPGEALSGAVTAYFDALLARGVTGYITGVEEGRILVAASESPWLAGRPVACWFEIPPGISPLPALGDKVTVSFERIIDMSYYPWVATAAGITVLEPQTHPGARLTETEAVAAALPLPEERYNYVEYRMVWALKEIVFDSGAGQWLLTFANGWDMEMESIVAVDDATGAVIRLRPAFIISEDLFVNGVDYFRHRPDRVQEECVDKVVQTLGEPLDRQPREKEECQQFPDQMVYCDTWHYQGISFKLVTLGHKDDPEPVGPGRLAQIYITGSQFKTFRGTKVGDTLEEVFEKYGLAETHDDRLYYGGGLEFVIKNAEVAGIILTGDYITGNLSF